LARIGQAFVELSNSEDHLAHLDPDASGLIVHLHGDLRSDVGLVLTSAHYRAAESSAAWDYWRQKLAPIFQMNRVIVIGQSLTDANIRAILSAAKKGSGVTRPVCWIAPDVRPHDARRYLEDYRIRVVSYDNRGGDHRNLRALVDTISMFVPPRTARGGRKLRFPFGPPRYHRPMWSLFYLVIRILVRLIVIGDLRQRDEHAKDLEILVLRHQLRVLQRTASPPRLRTIDRVLLAAASRVLPRDRWVAFLVTPATLLRWHRELVRRKWTHRRSGRPGRPPIDPEVRTLIIRLAGENPPLGLRADRG
jgi:hypothetical protein